MIGLFQGDGIGALTFGNCNKLGKVIAYLNDKEITTVGPKTETQIEFSFQDGDILKIVEFDVAIIMFNDFKVVTCYESCIGKKHALKNMTSLLSINANWGSTYRIKYNPSISSMHFHEIFITKIINY